MNRSRFLIILLTLWLGQLSAAVSSTLVTYGGAGGGSRFYDVQELSDRTLLVAGSCNSLSWIPGGTPVTALADPGINHGGGGEIPVLLHLSEDQQTLLQVLHLPAGSALNFRWIRSTEIPGQTTGGLLVSGGTDSGYFIARLDNNFVQGVPSAVSWLVNVAAAEEIQEHQPWDCGSDGRVVFVSGPTSAAWVGFLDSQGQVTLRQDLRASHREAGGSFVKTTGSSLANAAESRIYFPSDVQSWTPADQNLISSDGNGGIRKGAWPADIVLPVYNYGGYSWGYTGYRAAGKFGVTAVTLDRRNNDFYIGFNIQTRFYASAHNTDPAAYGTNSVPDFEPAVVAYTADGALKWWSRLYSEAVDNNQDGQITHVPYDGISAWNDPDNVARMNSNETSLSTPDQYVDALAIDYSAAVSSSGTLVVVARAHGNQPNNLWKGNQIHNNPSANSFHNAFTGSEGNIHISWLGKLDLEDGALHAATYLGGFFRKIINGKGNWPDTPYSDPKLDGWPSHNAGWPDLTSTTITSNAIDVDASGRVLVVGRGPRMVTTVNAHQKLPKRLGHNNPVVDEGTAPWNAFARVYTPDFSSLEYSTALTGEWTYPGGDSSQDPVGADNTELLGITASSNGFFVVGMHESSGGTALGNPIPVKEVPAWGTATPNGETGIFSRLAFQELSGPDLRTSPRGSLSFMPHYDELTVQDYEPGQHPRLFFRYGDIEDLRNHAESQQILRDLKAMYDDPTQHDRWVDREQNYGIAYLLTGDTAHADHARDFVLRTISDPSRWEARPSHPLRAGGELKRVAMTYDLCYNAWKGQTVPATVTFSFFNKGNWETETRNVPAQYVGRELTEAISEALLNNARLCAYEGTASGWPGNTQTGSNWHGWRYAAPILAALASDTESVNGATRDEIVQFSLNRLITHLESKYSTLSTGRGWDVEGHGYHAYEGYGVYPAVYALKRLTGIDAVATTPGFHYAAWTYMATMVPIPTEMQNNYTVGIHPDFADDHNSAVQGNGGISFAFTPDNYQGGQRWMFDRLMGSLGEQSYGMLHGGGLFTFLYYPFNQPAEDPAVVWNNAYYDPAYGTVGFRNQYQDRSDILFMATANLRRDASNTAHHGADELTFRLIGLGEPWVIGAGRQFHAGGQPNITIGDPAAVSQGKLGDSWGQEVRDVFLRGSGDGITVMASRLDDANVQNHVRRMMVDYSGDSGAEGAFLIHSTSDNGGWFSLPVPATHSISLSGNTFTITSGSGSQLRGKVLYPASVSLRERAFTRSSSLEWEDAMGQLQDPGVNAKVVDFAGDGSGEFLVALFLENNSQEVNLSQVTAVRNAGIWNVDLNGGRQVTIDGDQLLVTGWERPVVNLTSPAQGTDYTTGAQSVTLSGNVELTAGRVLDRVEIFRDGEKVGDAVLNGNNWSFQTTVLDVGVYDQTYRALAYDTDGNYGYSPYAAFTINNSVPPLLTLTSPSPQTYIADNSTILLTGAVADPDGTIQSLKVYESNTLNSQDVDTLLGDAVIDPASGIWSFAVNKSDFDNPPPLHRHSFLVVVVDGAGDVREQRVSVNYSRLITSLDPVTGDVANWDTVNTPSQHRVIHGRLDGEDLLVIRGQQPGGGWPVDTAYLRGVQSDSHYLLKFRAKVENPTDNCFQVSIPGSLRVQFSGFMPDASTSSGTYPVTEVREPDSYYAQNRSVDINLGGPQITWTGPGGTGTRDAYHFPGPNVPSDGWHAYEIERIDQRMIIRRDGVEIFDNDNSSPEMGYLTVFAGGGGFGFGQTRKFDDNDHEIWIDDISLEHFPADTPPVVTLDFPAADLRVNSGTASVTFSGTVSDDVSVDRVEIYTGGTYVGDATLNGGSWSYSLNSPQVGTYAVYAKAFDNRNQPGSSNAVDLYVMNAGTASAPTIVNQPDPQTVTAGELIRLEVVATGNPRPKYQWRKDGTDLLGATAPVLELKNSAAEDDGVYTVRVYNTEQPGGILSAAAEVTVNVPVPTAPFFVSHPASASVPRFGTHTLVSLADGYPAPTYQWYKDNVEITGATGAELVMNDLQYSDSGNYYVVAENENGTALSATAAISVEDLPIPPQVTLTRPTSAETLLYPNDVILEADASDLDGSVSLVEYRVNGNLVGSSSTPPYTVSWPSPFPGTYSVVATAYDNDSPPLSASSSARSVTVEVDGELPQILMPGRSRTAVNEPFVFGLQVANGPVTSFAVSGLPAWASFDTTTGVLTGTPTQTGSTAISFTATSLVGTSVPVVLNLEVVDGTESTLPVVRWHGDYVSATQFMPGHQNANVPGLEFGDDGLNDDGLANRPFSLTAGFSPTSNYAGTSSAYYGGYALWVLDKDGTKANLEIREEGGFDRMRIRFSNGDTRRLFYAQMWRKTDFLQHSTTPNLRLSHEASLGMSITQMNGGLGLVRFLVESGGQIYISQTARPVVGALELSGNALMSEMWAPYDPAVNLQPDPGHAASPQSEQLNYSVSSELLTDVTAVGYFVERATYPKGGDNILEIALFEAVLSDETVTPPVPLITSSTISVAQNRQFWNYQITATESPTSYQAAGLPVWATLNSSTGLISGTPDTAGSSSFTVSAVNGGGSSAPLEVTLTVNPTVPVITSSSSVQTQMGQFWSYQITATENPDSFAAAGLPGWASLNSASGLISGTPDAEGMLSFTVTAENADGVSSPLNVTLNVLPQPPVITSAGSDSAQADLPWSYQITASGNPTSYGASGLPAWASLNSSSGEITGIPPAEDIHSFSVTAQNAGGTSPAQNVTLTVAPGLPVSSELFVYALDENSGSTAADSSGKDNHALATGSVSWGPGVTGNALILDDNGAEEFLQTGSAVSVDSQSGFTAMAWVRPDDISSTSGIAILQQLDGDGPGRTWLNINNADQFSSFIGGSGTVDTQTVITPGEWVHLAVTVGAGTDATVSLYVNGVLAATHTETVETNTAKFRIGHFKTESNTGFQFIGAIDDVRLLSEELSAAEIDLIVNPVIPPMVTSADTLSAIEGESWSYQITASGNPDSFSATGLPAWASIDNVSGLISGTPVTQGTVNFSVSAENAGGSSAPLDITLTVQPPIPQITSPATAVATVGEAFSLTVTASGSPESFSATGLPGWLTLDAVSGELSGTPQSEEVVNMSLTASNISGTSDPQNFTLTVQAAPSSEILLYALDENSGNTAVDRSANANHAQATGSVDWGAGRSGNALLLDDNGAEEFLQSTSTVAVDSQSGYTAMAWVRPDDISSSTGIAILQQLDGSGPGRTWLNITNGDQFSSHIGGTGIVDTQTVIVPGEWVHLAVTVGVGADAAVNLYVNGELKATHTETVEANDAAFRIGHFKTESNTGFQFIGAIDDVRLLGEELSAAEIDAIANPLQVPVVTSASSTSAEVGQSWSYQITATENPDSFAVTGLPDWAVLDPNSGSISGTPDSAGSINLGVTASNAAGSSSEHVVVLTVAPAPEGSQAIQQNQDAANLVVIEAEDYDGQVVSSTHSWTEDNTVAGAVGTVLTAGPDSGLLVNVVSGNNTPMLSYTVNFHTAGTYYVWVRGRGGDGTSDSVHTGLNGVAQVDSDRHNLYINAVLRWRETTMDGNARAVIVVPSAGEHTVNLWMREDGAVVDRLLLTTDVNYDPKDPTNGPNEEGPAASVRSGGSVNQAPVALADSLTTPESVGISLAVLNNDSDPEGEPLTITGVTQPANGTAMHDGTQVTYTPNAGFSGNDSFSYTVSDGSLSDTATVSCTVIPAASGWVQGVVAPHLLVFEAEDYDLLDEPGTDQWLESVAEPTASGSVMVTDPDDGDRFESNELLQSPRMDFEVEFSQSGVHYIWVRGEAPDSAGDSLHVGINGMPDATSERHSLYIGGGMRWRSATMNNGARATIDVSSAGSHTVNVWMREDGAVIDRILFTTDPDYDPSTVNGGTGPANSNR